MPFFSNNAALLPPEVLMTIFEQATHSSTRDIDHLVELPPFEAIYAHKRERQDKQALQTKLSLSLTCSLFRRLTMKLLHEDIWIGHGSEVLLKTLQDSRTLSWEGINLGKFVKRVTLLAVEPGSPAEVVTQILALCPNVRVLSRPAVSVSDHRNDSSTEDSILNGLSFSQLHRIDWINVSFGGMSSPNVSPCFIWHSPCLRVLTLAADDLSILGMDRTPGEDRQVLINLPQLHTLLLRSSDALGDPDESWYSVQLPSLQRIVLERPLALYALHAGCLVFYGSQIKTLELGRCAHFLRIDAVSVALGYCPNVETLLFPVFSTMPPAKNHLDTPHAEWLQYRVKHIGLNASIEDGCDYQVSRTWMWVQLGDLVDALFGEGSRFTALECITLYGSEWRELVRDEAFGSIAKAVHSSRATINCEDSVTAELVQKIQ